MKRKPEVERGDNVLVWSNRYVVHRFYRMTPGGAYKMRCGKSFSKWFVSFDDPGNHRSFSVHHCKICRSLSNNTRVKSTP